ncbi:hypothetical protein [Nonomuraea lactucae]|uniref:hypothetical protein n=1 Tax=Nonomuraea lactucae TaxID=2249762 RepID=UPI000DE2F727|nr:hypothetical protein [Nonomuraea lactucae]
MSSWTFVRARLDEAGADERAALDWEHHKRILTDQFMNDPRRKHVHARREPVTDAQLAEYGYDSRFDRPACSARSRPGTAC